jgi:N-formylglutamate amidohydrolase
VANGVIDIRRPAQQTAPLVFSSPHSGTDYAADFIAESRLDEKNLRRSEDSFVDEIFAAAPKNGAPLLCALYPRAFLDPNREPYELDPQMFADPLPDHVKTRSDRVRAGFGTIARLVASGAEIYAGKLPFAEAERRIAELYRPYHAALETLVERTREDFGVAFLLDCHSMPSIGGPTDRDRGAARPDIVLGDRFGTSCTSTVTDMAERILRDLDLSVGRNDPYAGAFTTAHYGRPSRRVHAVQIEVNRRLYMDEVALTRSSGLPALQEKIDRFIATMAEESVGLAESF